MVYLDEKSELGSEYCTAFSTGTQSPASKGRGIAWWRKSTIGQTGYTMERT